MRPLNAGVPGAGSARAISQSVRSQEVDDLKAVQAASGWNTEDGVHYHCGVQFAHSLPWQHISS